MLNFMGIGAQKCGTSWLHSTLSMHPEIAFPGGKEVHYWDRPDGRDIDWYDQLFSNEGAINGDITPAYGFLSADVIQRIYSIYPELPLIYLIRNPIERAWSSARMALGRAEMQHHEASDQWFIDHFHSHGSLARGDYEKCIRQWRNIFPSKQLLIIRYEDIIKDPVGIANKCLNHFHKENFFSEEHQKQLSQRVFEGDSFTLRPTLINALAGIYANKISSLSKYLDQDLSDWQPIKY